MFDVGAFEQYEEGFIFLVSLNTKDEADALVERLKYYQEKLPVYQLGCSDQELEVHIAECDKIDAEVQKELGVAIPVSLYINGFYEFIVVEKKAL